MIFGEIGEFLLGVSSAVTVILTLRNGRKIDVGNKKIEAVHQSTNGKMDALLKLTGEANFAAGQKDEKDKGEQGKDS